MAGKYVGLLNRCEVVKQFVRQFPVDRLVRLYLIIVEGKPVK